MNEYTTSQFAKRVSRSTDTVQRWRREGTLVASHSQKWGKLTVHLYTDEDVRKALRIIKKRETGIAS